MCWSSRKPYEKRTPAGVLFLWGLCRVQADRPQAAPALPGPAGSARRNRPPGGLACGLLPLRKPPQTFTHPTAPADAPCTAPVRCPPQPPAAGGPGFAGAGGLRPLKPSCGLLGLRPSAPRTGPPKAANPAPAAPHKLPQSRKPVILPQNQAARSSHKPREKGRKTVIYGHSSVGTSRVITAAFFRSKSKSPSRRRPPSTRERALRSAPK